MAETKHNYADNVKKYTSDVDTGAVDGIVKHLGIALRSKDASYVASTDPEEMKRVRDHFLKKKLALTESDAELDAAVKAVTTKMKAERDKHRVTVYYLLAEKYGKLDMFKAKARAAKG
jgi:heptaprenylglyceryl phosphate synthase